MATRTRILLSGIAASLAASPTPGAAKLPPGVPTKSQIAACPAFEDVDFRKIVAERTAAAAPQADWRARMDAQHAQTRGPFASIGAAPDAKIVLRIWAGPGETQETPTSTSSLVWLGADDVWRFHRVNHAANRPPPMKPPPAPDANGVAPPEVPWTVDELELFSRDEIEGVLEPGQVEGIESTLADPCFLIQPDSMPFEVPVRKGKPPRQPCWGVIGGTLEIAWADGRRRDVTELCGGFYASAIISAVMYARPFVEDSATKAACDWLRAASAPDAAERRELAFCNSGLAAEIARRALPEAERDALYADAATMAPLEMMKRHWFLSLWSAGALKRARARIEGR
ncbi:MAG TPA: hypothetical protein VIT45_16080 [Allosphingosinicella sp.]